MSASKSLSLIEKVYVYLKDRPDEKYTAKEIAKWIFDTDPEFCDAKRERSTKVYTDKELVTQLTGEISSRVIGLQKKDQRIKIIEGHPRKLYYTKSTDDDEIEQAEDETRSAESSVSSKDKKREHDLYPLLSQYLWLSELKVHSKRIDEKASTNKRGAGGNEWLYPDIVGLEDLSSDWHQGTKDLNKEYGDEKTKLWSFEVKVLINSANVRKSFFQTVSTSAWANFGYLVAGEIQGRGVLKELGILSSLHGIGVILLNADSPMESELRIPARERASLDWDTMNRLLEANKDFGKFIMRVKEFYQTGNLKEAEWDGTDSEGASEFD